MEKYVSLIKKERSEEMIRIKSELKKKESAIIELEAILKNFQVSNKNLIEENNNLKEKVERFGQIFTFVKRKSSKPIFESEKSTDTSRDLLELSKNRTQSAHEITKSYNFPTKEIEKSTLSISHKNSEIKPFERENTNTRYSKLNNF